jgi:hypothetical protein
MHDTHNFEGPVGKQDLTQQALQASKSENCIDKIVDVRRRGGNSNVDACFRKFCEAEPPWYGYEEFTCLRNEKKSYSPYTLRKLVNLGLKPL